MSLFSLEWWQIALLFLPALLNLWGIWHAFNHTFETPLERVLFGPSSHPDGQVNLIGALRRAMATTGYSDLKEFQRVEVVVAPYQHS